MDPNGFQPSLVESPGSGGLWQGPPPPSLPHHNHPGRFAQMSPRDLHFPYENYLNIYV